MFWTQCDKIVTSGGPVKCDFCPCPKYIYVTRCDKTENDFDDCDCNPETAWERARLVTYFASENGCINVDGAWRRLNHTYYPADGSEFSANGSVYKAIETGENGPKTYDTRPKAQTEWDAHPKSHWGEKVIAACTCCCLIPQDIKATFTYYSNAFQKQSSVSSEEIYRVNLHYSETLKLKNNGPRTISGSFTKVTFDVLESIGGRTTSHCTGSNKSLNNGGPIGGFAIELDEDCKTLYLTSYTPAGVTMEYYPDGCSLYAVPSSSKVDRESTNAVSYDGTGPYGTYHFETSSYWSGADGAERTNETKVDLILEKAETSSNTFAFLNEKGYNETYQSLSSDLKFLQ